MAILKVTSISILLNRQLRRQKLYWISNNTECLLNTVFDTITIDRIEFNSNALYKQKTDTILVAVVSMPALFWQNSLLVINRSAVIYEFAHKSLHFTVKPFMYKSSGRRSHTRPEVEWRSNTGLHFPDITAAIIGSAIQCVGNAIFIKLNIREARASTLLVESPAYASMYNCMSLPSQHLCFVTVL